eukprot:Unigene2355_Nuclearia_a/m.7268 Unigene2355_Nuclearia_a/g.7268  ORF Unigene2355_Nuclearia_a/g.7268 Unigene2355_Nuclearia_a/m.7268 type:complete len:289 (+) Unigene2355_Nuclearia_a:27-893(+)
MPGASRSRAHCSGRLVHGPSLGGVAGSAALIVVPTVLFFVFTAPFYRGPLAVLPALTGVLCLVSLASLFTTSLTDPGILPRAPEPPDEALAPYKKVVHVKGRDIESKYCHTCHIYKPPRTTHCSVCNNCVERFDHHCPWTSNCIGRRNYRFFLTFVFVTVAYALAIVALCIGHVVASATDGTAVTALRAAPVSFALIFYAVAAAGSVGFLAVFHCQLLAGSVTTNEKLTLKYMTGNPFKRPLGAELTAICSGPLPSSFVRQLARGDEGPKELADFAAEVQGGASGFVV